MPEATHSRNSILRDIFKFPIEIWAEILHKHGFTADQLTKLGLVANIVSAVIVAKDSQKPKSERMNWLTSASILLLPKIITDPIDGTLARKQGTNNPELDVAADRISEIVATTAIALTNPEAKNAAIANQVTSIGPSDAKAYAETLGVIVPELDPSSYPVRVATVTAASVFPEQAKNILWLQTAANVFTTVKRLNLAIKHKENPVLTEEVQEKSRKRLKLLLGLTAVSIVSAIVVDQVTKFPSHSRQ